MFETVDAQQLIGAATAAVALAAVWWRPAVEWAKKFLATKSDVQDDNDAVVLDVRALQRLEKRQATLQSEDFGKGLELVKRSFFG